MSRVDHVNRLIAGTCMVAAPVMLLIAAIVMPDLSTNEATQLAAIADSPDRWYIASALLLAALALAVPAVLGLAHMLRERQMWMSTLGAGAALVGILASVGSVAIGLVAWQMTQGGAPVQMVLLLDRVNDTAGIWIPFTLGALGVAIGLLLLAGGLAMIDAVNPVIALLIAVGGVCATIGFPLASELLVVIGAACLCVGLGVTGLMVLRETDEDWVHTPTFRGFGALAGTH
ncbi:hypothetical protein [Conexibacter arvalis]|uniref:DUF4386 family protein n=1 Tax=Conexibacter arvalis TaxID=912552 RepID=A0A840IFM0_9ACTN|nr:hypothetical protein [Conexibacter arvalis]MBB4662983.1 hypothetical protein [Conexibacter arvalis]